MQGELFIRGACKEKPCRGICLAEVLARKSHAGGIVYQRCLQGEAMQEGCV